MGWNLDALFPNLTKRVDEVKELPPMPEVAQGLLRLKDDPNSDAKKLGRLIELDPSLASQIMRYARSAFFGYQGKIDSIQDAVSRVLGFDKAMHIAIGLAAGRALKHDNAGPLGVQAFWKHAIYSASLMQALAAKMPVAARPSIGMVYLSGLVHNIGYLLLGHLLEAEFNTLNEAVADNPQKPVTELESALLGTTHQELGAWLLRKWKMPPEVLSAVMNHHNGEFQGEYATYANLTLVADCLLKRHGIGDGESEAVPAAVMTRLGLQESQAEAMLDALLQDSENLDVLVGNIVSG
jgi:HD-like signal output (HDOD) protein